MTDSQHLIASVDQELRRMLSTVVHRERVETALRNQSALALVRDLDQGLNVVDEWAAEHLEVITRNARDWANRVTNADAAEHVEALGAAESLPSHVAAVGARFAQ